MWLNFFKVTKKIDSNLDADIYLKKVEIDDEDDDAFAGLEKSKRNYQISWKMVPK